RPALGEGGAFCRTTPRGSFCPAAPALNAMNFDSPPPDRNSVPPADRADAAPRRGPAYAVTGVVPPQLAEAVIRDVRPGIKARFPALANVAHLLLGLPSFVAGKLPSVPIVTAVLWPVVWTALALPCIPLAALLLAVVWPVTWVLVTLFCFISIF